MSDERKPWAFVMTKDGRFGGVTIADKDANKFVSKFIKDGYAVTTVYDRAEYLTVIEKYRHP